MGNSRSIRRSGLGYTTALVSALSAATPVAAAPTVGSIVRTLANAAISAGYAPGIEVAIVRGSAKPAFYGFGVTTVGTTNKPTPRTLFQIASVTKVFTTNLLGQAVQNGMVSLDEPLSDFTAALGTLPANTASVTLEDLADFTGGFPSLAPPCGGSGNPADSGCLPYGDGDRPTIKQYTGQDFAAFFRHYDTGSAPPHPYFYSDFSLGLTGLLLGTEPGSALSNRSLRGWKTLLKSQLLRPLTMDSTFMNVPDRAAAWLAPGYTQALADANVLSGGVTSLNIVASGSNYATAPDVTITGGGGTGASYTAQLNDGGVSGFQMVNPGSGYIAPPQLVFSGGGKAAGSAIIKNGHVVGVLMRSGGSYTSTPTITFSGGRIGGHDARGTVFVDHDTISFVQITDPGAGYVDPVTVNVAPPPPSDLAVPIWAPAGALKSSARDLATFAAAALGHTTIGTLEVPPAISAGFAVAETPYACEGASPSLSGCTAPLSGLAWDIYVRAPKFIVKDGGLPGYSSTVLLLPEQDTAIVVLMNSFQGSGFAPTLGADIASALYHSNLLQSTR